MATLEGSVQTSERGEPVLANVRITDCEGTSIIPTGACTPCHQAVIARPRTDRRPLHVEGRAVSRVSFDRLGIVSAAAW